MNRKLLTCLLAAAIAGCGSDDGSPSVADASVNVDSGETLADASVGDDASVSADAGADATTGPETTVLALTNGDFEAADLAGPGDYTSDVSGHSTTLTGSGVTYVGKAEEGPERLVVEARGYAEQTVVNDTELPVVAYDDTYTFTALVGPPPPSVAVSEHVALMILVEQNGEWKTAIREAIAVPATGYEDRSITLRIPAELHGLRIRVGVYVRASVASAVVFDDLRLERVRTSAPLPASEPRLLNASFEDAPIPVGHWTSDVLHWNRLTSSGYIGVARHSMTQLEEVEPLASPAAGNQALELDSGVFLHSEAITGIALDALLGNSYRITFAAAKRKDVRAATLNYGFAIVGSEGDDRTHVLTGTPTGEGVWNTFTDCVTLQPADEGKTLHVRFTTNDRSGSALERVLVDNIRVERLRSCPL